MNHEIHERHERTCSRGILPRPPRSVAGHHVHRQAAILTIGALFDTIPIVSWNAEVAQLVEHLTENQGVPSSSLGFGTKAEVAQW